MAPRPPESLHEFMKRLKRAINDGQTEVPFGAYHFNHAVCIEDGAFRVRRLEATTEDIEAFRAEHGMFMPENLEALSRPKTLVHEAKTLDALASWLEPRWPL